MDTLQHARWLAGRCPDPQVPTDAGQRRGIEHALGRATASSGGSSGRHALPVRGGVPVVAPEALGHFFGITGGLSVGVVANTQRIAHGERQQGEEGEDGWKEAGGMSCFS